MVDTNHMREILDGKTDLEKRKRELEHEAQRFENKVTNEFMKGNMIQFLSVNWSAIKRNYR